MGPERAGHYAGHSPIQSLHGSEKAEMECHVTERRVTFRGIRCMAHGHTGTEGWGQSSDFLTMSFLPTCAGGAGGGQEQR